MNRQLRALVLQSVRSTLRDRTALFFIYALPLMFLLIFGLLFGGNSGTRPKVLVVGSGSVVSHLPSEVLNVKSVGDEAKARKDVSDGNAAAVLRQDGDVVHVDYSGADRTTSATILGIMDSVVNHANLVAAGATNPKFSVQAAQVEDRSLSAIEFLVPGLLGYGLSISAVFGLAQGIVNWRGTGLLRRLMLTPVRPSQLAAGRVIAALIVAITQAIAFLIVGVVVFDLHLRHSWWMAFPVVAAGALAFLSIGFVVAAFAKTQEAASAIANVITLPMAFLGGAFVPLDVAPGWVQGVARVLPLYYVTEGLKDVMVRGKGPASALLPMAVLVGIAVVLSAIGVRLFRWDA